MTRCNWLLYLAASLGFVACATNPATGRLQLSFIGEEKEIAMGREADPEIVASMGLYDDPELQAYVERLGLRLAGESERPHLPWTFRVLDDPVVNAFALPGGYIYLTRGILAYLDSEAELASVLGHEIGHVTGRHSVNRISKSRLLSVGMNVGMMVKPELQRFGNLAETGLGLLFLKYSRDDEREADDLGLRYLARWQYELAEMPKVFAMLGRVGASAGEDRPPAWLSTHPDPADRQARAQKRIARLGPSAGSRVVGRGEYLDTIDGLVFGDNPRHGFFEDSRFLHPDLEFEFHFPSGWKTINQRHRVAAVNEARSAMVEIMLASGETPEGALEKFLSSEKVRRTDGWQKSLGGLPSVWAAFSAPGKTSLHGTVGFVRHGRNIFRVLGVARSDVWQGASVAVEKSLESFRRLTDREALSIQPARLRTVKLDRPLSFEQFQRQHPSSVPVDKVALLNRIDPGATLPAGRILKRITAGNTP
ncbi:MAG: M48 family metalloprotease [Acidobacteriota bacterium]